MPTGVCQSGEECSVLQALPSEVPQKERYVRSHWNMADQVITASCVLWQIRGWVAEIWLIICSPPILLIVTQKFIITLIFPSLPPSSRPICISLNTARDLWCHFICICCLPSYWSVCKCLASFHRLGCLLQRGWLIITWPSN